MGEELSSWLTTGTTLGQRAALACILEATARKPGNVHPWAAYADATYVDFVLSALAIAPVLDRVEHLGVGPAVLEAVKATRQVAPSNTNLGLILLLVPLAAAACRGPIRSHLLTVIDSLTVDDSRSVFEAIRLARPGGLGTVPEEDVHGQPSRALRDVMRLAAERDLVARQYANGFAQVWEAMALLHEGFRSPELDWETSILRCFLQFLAHYGDTLVARKRGPHEAEELRRRAQAVLGAGWPQNPVAREVLQELDAWLRAEGSGRNPGTTADLIGAALFALLVEEPELVRRAVARSVPSLPWRVQRR
jgi:triphosphoribosyl-dephospho-CoA synthase